MERTNPFPVNTTTPSNPSSTGTSARPNVADHELIRVIGRGAYGEIWLARNHFGTLRAVKVVRRSSFEHARPYEREFNGIKSFEPLSREHEGLVNILHVGRDDSAGCFYYVMELADDARAGTSVDTYQSRTLRSELRGRGRLPVAECVEIGQRLAAALAHLHGSGLLHRDIKPSNIIFVEGQPKLADIGLVSAGDEARSFVGTDGFIPPEGPGHRGADLYALGKVLYEISTGKDRLDFPAAPAAFDSDAERAAFAELNFVLLRASASDASERYRDAAELRSDLLVLQAGGSLARIRRLQGRLQTARRWGLVGGGLALVAAGAIALQTELTRQAREQRDAAAQRATDEENHRRAVQSSETIARETLYAADMNLAQQSLDRGDTTHARELLARYLPNHRVADLRGIEWRLFWQQVNSSVSNRFVSGITNLRHAVKFSPEGRWMAGPLRTGGVGVWEANRARWLGHVATIEGGWAFGSNGNDLYAFSEPNQFRRWLLPDLTADAEVGLATNQEKILPIISPGGHWVAALSPTAKSVKVRIWNGRNGQVAAELPAVETVSRLAFSPSATHLAVAIPQEIQVWQVEPLKRVATLRGQALPIEQMAISTDGNWLAAGGDEDTVRVWSVADERVIATFTGHGSGTLGLQFAPDDRTLMSKSHNDEIVFYRIASEREAGIFRVPGVGGNCWPSIAPNGERIAITTRDGQFQIWPTPFVEVNP
jgi:serine/threonine protein kinase/WD40 repeat protein